MRMAELVLDSAAQGVMQRAVALALGGDVAALQLCFDRLVTIRRERPVQLPLLGTAEDVGDALDAITAAVAAGEITPGEAAARPGTALPKARGARLVLEAWRFIETAKAES